MSQKDAKSMEEIVSLSKRRGFVYPTSEIYGGLANSYDYGPYGAQLLRNIRNIWWKVFIEEREDMVGIDTQIMLHPKTWVASGHVGSFNDPMVEDKKTHKRYRADHLIEEFVEGKDEFKEMVVEDLGIEEMTDFIKKHEIKSPDGNEITEPKAFNLLFETAIGTVSGDKSKVYMRGETAQGIFTSFKQVLDSTRVKLPFGIGQIGKSFRNEITTGQFVFRTLEFEQAEIEYFFDPEKEDWKELLEQWKRDMWKFISGDLGISENNLRWRKHTDKERSHYSEDTYDLDYKFPFGWKELWGLAYRTDYDLKQHIEFSKENLDYTDPKTQKKFVPYVIEPAVGVNRLFLMILADAYYNDKENKRVVLRLDKKIAPVQVAVFPLLKNKEKLVNKAKAVFDMLKTEFICEFDDHGNVGKRYRRQDEIGTPYCVTVDFDSLEDDTVTIRDRDTMEQKRMKIDELEKFFWGELR